MIILTALWLGILTSISPCPLATNIAAVSFISKAIVHPRKVFLSGLLYTLGRMLAYAILGFLIIKSVLSVPLLANFLQKYMNKALGPILIAAGLFLLNVIRFEIPGLSITERHQRKMAAAGLFGAFTLGFIFALSFCPISAALFFGSLIPLAINNRSGLMLPFIYGAGTSLPVIIFSLGIALGVSTIGRWFRRVASFEKYARIITGVVFIAAGICYVFIYILPPM